MPTVIKIIKERWQEFLLVVVFFAGIVVISTEFSPPTEPERPESIPGWAGFLLGAGTATLAIIGTMLYLGFLATAYHEGEKTQEPMTLLRAGRMYFWRLLRFQIIFGLVWFGTAVMIVSLFGTLVMGLKEGDKIPTWLMSTGFLAGSVIFIKPMLLTPAVMIVHNRMVIESLAALKKYRITDAKGLLILAGVSFAVMYAVSSVANFIKTEGAPYYILSGGYSIISSVFVVTMGLAATRFVATRNFEQPSQKHPDDISN